MKVTDNKLVAKDKELLATLIGSELEFLISDKISSVRPMSFGIVGICVGGRTFALRADIGPGEPFGEPDDVVQLSFREEERNSIRPICIGTQQAEYRIGRNIKGIVVYEDTIERLAYNKVVSRYISTAAIAFLLEGTELVFENQGWLDEVIDIHRGPGASHKVRPPEAPIEDDDPEDFRVLREAISLGKK
ncbi:MAG: hypothetical protein Q4B45_01120 [Coriobacteriia bacterium]|nr:hypothetical protein [Coriobacteriia bacterium]